FKIEKIFNPERVRRKPNPLKGSAVGKRFQRSVLFGRPGLSLRSNRWAEISERLRRNFKLRHYLSNNYLGTMPVNLDQHTRLAEDLVAAYNSANVEAVERLNNLIHSSLS